MNDATKKRITLILISSAAVVAVFAPSSSEGNVNVYLSLWSTLLLAGIATVIGSINRIYERRIFAAGLVILLLIACTFISEFQNFTPGAFAPYLLLISVLGGSMGSAGLNNRHAVFVFECISIVVQTFALCMIFGVSAVSDLNSSLYRAYSDDLYESMIVWYNKPVTVFATHSAAAFMYFAFLATHLELALVSRSKLRQIFSGASVVIYFYLLVMLTSATGYVLFILANIWLAYRLFLLSRRRITLSVIAVPLVIAMAGGVALFNLDPIVEGVINSFTSQDSGISGRYAYGGRLQGTYDYLLNNSFRPVGLTYDPQISLGDNFIAEYIIRGTILLYVLVLWMTYSFFKQSLLSKRVAIGFISFILISDLGYPLLTYYRAIGTLYLFILVWNYCTAMNLPLIQRPVQPGRVRLASRPRYLPT